MSAAQRGALKPKDVSRKEKRDRILPSTLQKKNQPPNKQPWETGVKVTGEWFEGLCTTHTCIPSWYISSSVILCQPMYSGMRALYQCAKLYHVLGMRSFSDSPPKKETPFAHLGGYLRPAFWSAKLPEGAEMLSEIYILRKQCDNLCCAVQCCHIIIELRCAGQMWNTDNKLYRAAQLRLWLASQAEQGELQAAQNASVSSSHYLTLIVGIFDLCTLWSCPFSSRSPIKSTHVLWEVQAA